MNISHDLVNELYTWHTIPMSGVFYSSYAIVQQAGSWICTSITWASTSPTDWKALESSQIIFQKISGTWEVCRVQTTGMFLKVDIPGGTVPGFYSGTIIITAPTF